MSHAIRSQQVGTTSPMYGGVSTVIDRMGSHHAWETSWDGGRMERYFYKIYRVVTSQACSRHDTYMRCATEKAFAAAVGPRNGGLFMKYI